jgi:oligopeptide/dipeptide ABC transporter ATP-binding protein
MGNETLLDVKGLHVIYASPGGDVRAVEDVSLRVQPGEFVAIVGESGSGKSTLAHSLIGLLPSRALVRGEMFYKGVNLAKFSNRDWLRFRGKEIGMIFQESMTSLNPIERVGKQLEETVRTAHNQGDGAKDDNGKDAKTVLEWLRKVRISDPESAAERYPFQLSGGMIQRVMIAMAISLHPSLLLADEPTTALDVTTQAQILKLMKNLIDETGTSVLLITHDLGVAAQVADRVIVMYAGEVVEEGPSFDVFSNPLHPYTKGLLSCYPKSVDAREKLETLAGSIPDLKHKMRGCKFADRCPHVMDICRGESPRYVQVEQNHHAKCTLYYR